LPTGARAPRKAMLAALSAAAAMLVAACQAPVAVPGSALTPAGEIGRYVEYPNSLPSAGRGEALWRQVCPACDADGFSQTYLGKDRRAISPLDVYLAVSDGVPDRGLPALKDRLAPPERWDVVAFLWSRNASRELMAQAEQAYLGSCSMCHGPLGMGDGSAAHGLEPPPASFALGGRYMWFTDTDLFQFISQGKPGTAMPPWRHILTAEERWLLVDFIRTFAYSAGEE